MISRIGRRLFSSSSSASALSHVNAQGQVSMVNVVTKSPTTRIASASGQVFLGKTTFLAVKNNTNQKGDVLTVAKVAGIQAAKNTANMIPLCHNILLDHVDVDCILQHKSNSIMVRSKVTLVDKTGCEMEALSAVSVACLTIYDMCKAMNKGIMITNIQLDSKSGGKSGVYQRDESSENVSELIQDKRCSVGIE